MGKDMGNKNEKILKYITVVIKCCEEIQNSNESDQTKQFAKLTAYSHIQQILEEIYIEC